MEYLATKQKQKHKHKQLIHAINGMTHEEIV